MSESLQLVENSSGAAETRQYATFYIADLFFGIETIRVQEILRYQEMTHIPLAAKAIEGLINLRGQIVTAIDVRRSLALESMGGDRTPMNIVIHADDGTVSLLVDEIGDVLDIALDSYAPVPENMPAQHRQFIDGVFRLSDRLMLSLNVEQLLQAAAN
jgi:purine-binding chemotaxis protein CheW